MTKVEACSSPEFIAYLESRARDRFISDARKVSELVRKRSKLQERVQETSESKIHAVDEQLSHAQEVFAGTLNTVVFFNLLDEDSHIGQGEPIKMPNIYE